jgi:hypothetical protein
VALSGKIYTNVDNGGAVWRLQLEWSAQQDVTNNKSNITAKLYWMSLDQYGDISSTASKTSAIQYNNGSWVTATSTAGISAYEKKLIQTRTFTITHDANGNASFSIDGYYDVQLNLTGKYVDRVDLTQTTFTLNTIEQDGKMWVQHSGDWDIGVAYVYASSAWRKSKNVYVYTGGVWKVDNTS